MKVNILIDEVNAYFHFPYYHCKTNIFYCSETYFPYFTGLLPDDFLLNYASTQHLREYFKLSKKEKKNVYDKQKNQVLMNKP
jgi:hypothetical protein